MTKFIIDLSFGLVLMVAIILTGLVAVKTQRLLDKGMPLTMALNVSCVHTLAGVQGATGVQLSPIRVIDGCMRATSFVNVIAAKI